ncbi:MAG: helix-turn-helix domain-containing protein [Planctomycetes bacterium]|nr:helix-turn-helix domain-containing protein [Planctomycetota bacterium]
MPADSSRKSFGKRVRALRKYRGWTQEELAVKAHMDSKSMGAIERGERNVTIDNVAKLARGLGVEMHQLFLFDARGIQPAEEVSEQRILDLVKTAPGRRKTLALAILGEVLNHQD